MNKQLIRALKLSNDLDENTHGRLKEESKRTLQRYKLDRKNNHSSLKDKYFWALRYLKNSVSEAKMSIFLAYNLIMGFIFIPVCR